MVYNIFSNNETAKIVSYYFTNISFIICPLQLQRNCIDVPKHFFIVFNILIHYENKYYERREQKQRFSILFFSNLANNQSIIKKVLISIDILNRTVNSSVDIPN